MHTMTTFLIIAFYAYVGIAFTALACDIALSILKIKKGA